MRQFLYVCWNCNSVQSFAVVQERDITCPICTHKGTLVPAGGEPTQLPRIKPIIGELPEALPVEPEVEPIV